jgi:hypothetical protein
VSGSHAIFYKTARESRSAENEPGGVNRPRCRLRSAGFGRVKEANLQRAKAKEADLIACFRSPPQPMPAE